MKGLPVTPRALVYGDVDLNLIDGSAIWAQAMVQALVRAGCEVTLVLKAPVRTDRLIRPLADLPGVAVRRPHEEGLAAADRSMSVDQAAGVLAVLDRATPFDLVVVRGRRLVARLAEGPLAGRLWTYLTDVPQSLPELDPAAVIGAPGASAAADGLGALDELTRIARASRFLLCQTEELRGFLESAVPIAAQGRCLLFPPVVDVPADCPAPSAPGARGEPLRLVYTGKFAPRWLTLEMTGLPELLAAAGVPAELHMVGDKIHHVPADPGYSDRMRAALTGTAGVVWHGGHSREAAMRLVAGCQVGLSWRSPELDGSLELSTKVLEMGALGIPVVLNRTPMHERLLGADYPLFAGGRDEVVDALVEAARPDTHAAAAARCRAAAAAFTLDAAAGRLRGYLARAFPAPPPALPARGRPLRVGVAGHDLKFFNRLLDHFRSVPGIEVRVDHWPALGVHRPERSQELADWADVVVCEWCGPNAVWYSRHKRPGQRLVVRLHRFELYRNWPARLDIGAVDQVICVSPHYAELTARHTGWPAGKITVVPNWVDVDHLDRAKLGDARHHLGMIGIAPSRKRLDLAVDVLAELRRADPRWTLFVKSKLPWEYPWIWGDAAERAHYSELLRRVRRSPLLSGAVVFDPYGPDVAAWLRRIGFVLSTSDDESFHLAPAEGMASGAVPALLPWPGSDSIYDRRWIHPGPEAMAEAISRSSDRASFAADAAVAREQVRGSYALSRVVAQWTDVLTGLPAQTA